MRRLPLLVLILGLGASALSCKKEEEEAPPPPDQVAVPAPVIPVSPTPEPSPTAPREIVLGDGLSYEIAEFGEGEAISGTDFGLYQTEVLDTEEDVIWQGRFEFERGSGMAFPGFDNGVANMKEGEIRRIDVPSELSFPIPSRGEVTPRKEPQPVVLVVKLLEITRKNP